MNEEDKVSRLKDNANLIMNGLLVIMMTVGGYLFKQVYESTNKTEMAVAVMQSSQLGFNRDLLSIQTELGTLRAKIQANEIEIIKIKERHQ